MHFHSIPSRESSPTALPDCEVFQVKGKADFQHENGEFAIPGWYWWPCFPGCLPDGDANGPFASESEAIADARAMANDLGDEPDSE